ncbi:MAG TPA: AraC family transcriptional regulator ligand-binding domain-containing protein [Casimicrobiaceae bacterium]|nr:AraC family transcriptional regulator ligand-binding domain-containing protein [Casimicrobiaceae bacterium]
MSGMIRSASLTNYADVARAVGLDPLRLLAEVGLPLRCLQDPELKIPLDKARQLLEISAERSGEEAFGLRMSETRQMSNLGPVGLLVREQPTLRSAIEAFIHYGRKLNGALFLTLEESGEVAVLREVLIVGHGGPVRQATELAIGVALRVLQLYLGPEWRALRVCFAHDAPAKRDVHDRVFGRRVEFGHDFNGMVFPRADLARPNPNADPAMVRYARQMIDSGDAKEEPVMTAQVRELIVVLLGSGKCSIDLVAQHLGVDRRTVHRRLAAEQQTYSGVLDAVRRELATRFMEDRTRTLAEVSLLLGFSAPSGFSRWYQEQFDRAPSAHRPRASRRQ